jgi:hypothetical protein
LMGDAGLAALIGFSILIPGKTAFQPVENGKNDLQS